MADNKFLDQQGLSAVWSQINNIFARVRRDNHYNYSDDFVPVNREICLVDTAGQGLRAKVGDGATKWKDLPFTDAEVYNAINLLVQRGYYYDGVFYSDSTHTTPLVASIETIYIDAGTSKIYIHNGSKYVTTNDVLPNASATQAGIIKLYSSTGQNIDGTMTQKAITDKLNTKVEAEVNGAEEILILSIN